MYRKNSVAIYIYCPCRDSQNLVMIDVPCYFWVLSMILLPISPGRCEDLEDGHLGRLIIRFFVEHHLSSGAFVP